MNLLTVLNNYVSKPDPWTCLSCSPFACMQNKVGGGEGLVGIYGSMTQAGTRAIMAAMAEHACMGPDSILVDIGAGLGRCGHVDLLLAQLGTLHTPLLLSCRLLALFNTAMCCVATMRQAPAACSARARCEAHLRSGTRRRQMPKSCALHTAHHQLGSCRGCGTAQRGPTKDYLYGC